MFIACYKTNKLGFLNEKKFFAYLAKYSTTINLYLRHFVKPWYSVIANLVHSY